LIFFVAGKVDDVATILEVVGIVEGRMLLHLAFPPGQLLWHWRRDEFRLWTQRKSRRAAPPAMAAPPSSGARGGEWVTLLVILLWLKESGRSLGGILRDDAWGTRLDSDAPQKRQHAVVAPKRSIRRSWGAF
jgi:hypothetical protein